MIAKLCSGALVVLMIAAASLPAADNPEMPGEFGKDDAEAVVAVYRRFAYSWGQTNGSISDVEVLLSCRYSTMVAVCIKAPFGSKDGGHTLIDPFEGIGLHDTTPLLLALGYLIKHEPNIRLSFDSLKLLVIGVLSNEHAALRILECLMGREPQCISVENVYRGEIPSFFRVVNRLPASVDLRDQRHPMVFFLRVFGERTTEHPRFYQIWSWLLDLGGKWGVRDSREHEFWRDFSKIPFLRIGASPKHQAIFQKFFLQAQSQKLLGDTSRIEEIFSLFWSSPSIDRELILTCLNGVLMKDFPVIDPSQSFFCYARDLIAKRCDAIGDNEMGWLASKMEGEDEERAWFGLLALAKAHQKKFVLGPQSPYLAMVLKYAGKYRVFAATLEDLCGGGKEL